MNFEDQKYTPGDAALLCFEQLDSYAPTRVSLSREDIAKARRAAKRKADIKVNGKQISLKKAVSNQTPKNFQGVALDRCTHIVDADVHVYLSKPFLSKTKRHVNPVFCNECNLVPCGMLAFNKELLAEAGKVEHMLHSTEDWVVDKLCWVYRGLIGKLFNKGFAHKMAASNRHMPKCADVGIRKLVSVEHGDGYDSLLEDNPYARAIVLDNQDNKRELKEIQSHTGMEVPARVMAAYKNTFPYSDSEEEASTDEEDQPLASLQEQQRKRPKLSSDYSSDQEEFEF